MTRARTNPCGTAGPKGHCRHINVTESKCRADDCNGIYVFFLLWYAYALNCTCQYSRRQNRRTVKGPLRILTVAVACGKRIVMVQYINGPIDTYARLKLRSFSYYLNTKLVWILLEKYVLFLLQ